MICERIKMFTWRTFVVIYFCAPVQCQLPPPQGGGTATILNQSGFLQLPSQFLPPIPGIGPGQIFGQPGVAQDFPPGLPRPPSLPPPSLPQPQPFPAFPQVPQTPFIQTPPVLQTPLIQTPPIPQAATLPAGFVCVPIGTCNPTGTSILDIRIVTPGLTNPCPSGQVPCGGSAGGNQCGLRFVNPVSMVDGFATPGAYPWQAYLVNQTGYAGSGVLLDQYNVLTAAHKVYMNTGTPNMIAVYMGVYDSAQLGIRYNVQRVLLHPNFNPSNLFNDLAILRLTTPVTPLTQQNVNTACLPIQGQSFVGQNCWVSGWGRTAFTVNDAPTRQQKQVQLPIVPYTTCYASMSNAAILGPNVNTYLDPTGELCAGGQATRDACTQDGGSPLVCNVNGRFTVAGLVIWGKGCGQPGVYGVYVNVANYVTWISNSIAVLNG